MISQITGKISQRTAQGLLIDVQGLCYEVFVPNSILQGLDGQASAGAEIRLYTFHYHHVEPSRAIPILIGFTNEVEREFFEQFITVSGVGPKAALRAISKPITQIARAIDQGDLEFLKGLPGIGSQRAKEIVAKLQGKVGKFGLLPDTEIPVAVGHQDIAQEALAILTQLQYKPAEAKTMVQQAMERVPAVSTAEELLNEVYRQRSSARKGFTLIELLITAIVLGLLVTLAFPRYTNSVERSRGAEVYRTFAFVRAGYLAYRDRTGAPHNFALTEAAATDGNWRQMGVENPNIPAKAYFRYRVLRPTNSGGLTPLTGYRAQAARRTALVSRRTGVDRNRFIEMQLDTGEIRKSAPY